MHNWYESIREQSKEFTNLTTSHNSAREGDGEKDGEKDRAFLNWDFNKFRIKPSKYLIWLLCNINSPLELILSWNQLVFYGAFIGRFSRPRAKTKKSRRRQSRQDQRNHGSNLNSNFVACCLKYVDVDVFILYFYLCMCPVQSRADFISRCCCLYCWEPTQVATVAKLM